MSFCDIHFLKPLLWPFLRVAAGLAAIKLLVFLIKFIGNFRKGGKI